MMDQYLLFVLKAFYFVLPGIFANMAPLLVRKVPFLAIPVDFGRNWRGKPVFGKNKTYRGFFFGMIASVLVVFLQRWLYSYDAFADISIVNYEVINILLFGFLMGFGVLFGDLVKSFFKRRLGIKPGVRFFPWDQLDSLIGGFLFLSIIYVAPREILIFLIVAVPIVHICTNHVAFYLGLKETKW
jgi:CDP-2,3-bis-(O-geranylgeranyl)-sn-glycerol synthase